MRHDLAGLEPAVVPWERGVSVIFDHPNHASAVHYSVFHSLHLPNSWEPLELFTLATFQLDEHLELLRLRRNRSKGLLSVSGDYNVMALEALPFTGPAVDFGKR